MNRVISALVCFSIFLVLLHDAIAQNKGSDSKGKSLVVSQESLRDHLTQLELLKIRLDGNLKILKTDFEYAKERQEKDFKETNKAIAEWKHNDGWAAKLKQKKSALERQKVLFEKEHEKRISHLKFLKERNAIEIGTVQAQLDFLENQKTQLPSPIKKSK